MNKKYVREKKPYLPLVYICSPYAGDTHKNVKNARIYSRFAIDNGCIPLTPHLMYPQFMSEEKERGLAMHFNYVLLGKCDQIWVFGDDLSFGMLEEIRIAKKRKMKIKFIKEVI